MIEANAVNLIAVDADSRYIRFKVELNVLPQEIEFDDQTIPLTHKGALSLSALSDTRRSQIHDQNTGISKHGITTELNRWIIGDLSFLAYDLFEEDDEVGQESNIYSSQTASMNHNSAVGYCFRKAGYVAGIGIDFPNNDIDGYGVRFDVYIGTDNEEQYPFSDANIQFNNKKSLFIPIRSGIYNPVYVRVEFDEWSLPNRRARVPEIWVGYHDEWTEDKFASLSITQRASFTPFSIPYTSCTLQLDNSDKLFDPTNKYGLFKMIEDRQPVTISMNLWNVGDFYDPDWLPPTFYEYFVIGKFYQYSNGWKTGNSDLSMTWNLVDLLGLLSDRKFDTTHLREKRRVYYGTEVIDLWTVEDWVKEILSQLGKKFTSLYEIPYSYASITLQPIHKSQVENVTCGDLLLWICQAINAWMRLTPDGKIYIGGFNRLGQVNATHDFDLSFDNLVKYPVFKANDDIARIDFTLPKRFHTDGTAWEDEGEKSYSVYSANQSSPNTQSIDNPFLVTEEQATAFSNYVFQYYGGNCLDTVGRGNPFREVGDYVYTEISKGAYMLGRVIEQTIEIKDYVMKDCSTTILCEDILGNYDTFVILTKKDSNGEYIDNPHGYVVQWSVPDNLQVDEDNYGKLKLVLVQAGQTGGHGDITVWDDEEESWIPGSKGDTGLGGYIFVGEVEGITRGDIVNCYIGKAADPRDIYIYNDQTKKWNYDTYINAAEGDHTTVWINGGYYSSDPYENDHQSQRYDEGYLEPVSGKRLGRKTQASPSPDSGDGGASGGSAYSFLESSEDMTPDDFDGRKVLGGGLGTKGADGCVIICYKAAVYNSEEVNADE